MKKILDLSLVIVCLLCSCNDNKNKDKEGLMGIPVDIEQDASLPLSAIAEEIKAIELEMTDESLVNPDRIQRVLISDDIIVVLEMFKALIFNENGEFLRSIGRRGQGPGEFTFGLANVAIDKKNKYLFLNTYSKIICYDLDGKFIKEWQDEMSASNGGINTIPDINFINDELWVFVNNLGIDSIGFFNRSVIYKLNHELQITGSVPVQDAYSEQRLSEMVYGYMDYLLRKDTSVFFYYANLSYEGNTPSKIVLRDTLYSLNSNRIFPELKLDFKNNGVDGNGKTFIRIENIYRSSRYIFADYMSVKDGRVVHQFCHDTKTGTSHNMQDGFTDDIHQIEGRVRIRPLNSNTELFYYWHTHMNPDDLEEPNPTLYIGKLKK